MVTRRNKDGSVTSYSAKPGASTAKVTTSNKSSGGSSAAPPGLSYDAIVAAQTGMDRDAIANQAQRITGGGSGPLSTPLAPITPESLAPVVPAPFIQPPVNPVPTAPNAADLFTTPPLTATPAETQAQGLADRIQELNNSLVGKSKAKTEADTKFGVDAAQKTINDLGAQLTGLNNEAAAIPLQLQQGAAERGVTTPMLGAQQNSRLRTNAIAALGVSSLMAAAQGQLANAQSLSDKAVEAKYGPIQEQITALTSNLNIILNSPNYTLQDKNRAQAQMDNQAKRQYELDLMKQNTADINKVALAAAANGANSATLRNIQNSKTAVDATRIAAAQAAGITSALVNQGGEWANTQTGKVYGTPEELFKDFPQLGGSFNRAYELGLVQDYTANTVADREFVSKLRETYPDAGISLNDDAQSAVDKLSGSNKYIRENYIDPVDSVPKPVRIGDADYFYDDSTGTYLPASSFIEGDSASGSTKYLNNNGGQLKLGVGQVDTLAGFDNTQAASERALQLLNEGAKTGPIAKTVLGVNKLLNQANPKQMELEQTLAQVKADFQKAISGATVSESERVRLEAFLPSISDQENTLKSKLERLKTEMQTKRNVYLETLGGRVNPNFSSAGNASASGNQLKGISQKLAPLPLLNMDGNPKTPNVPLAKAYPPGSDGGQCGIWVRNIVQKQGLTYPAVGNSLSEKAATAQKYGVSIPQAKIGSVVLTNENKTNGHVAYVIGKTSQGFIVAESNYGLNEKVSYGRVIPYNSKNILGILNPTKA